MSELVGYESAVQRPLGQLVAANGQVSVEGDKAFVDSSQVASYDAALGEAVLSDERRVPASLVRELGSVSVEVNMPVQCAETQLPVVRWVPEAGRFVGPDDEPWTSGRVERSTSRGEVTVVYPEN